MTESMAFESHDAMTRTVFDSSLTINSFSCLSVRIGFFCLWMIHDSMMIHPSHTTEKAQNLVVRFIGENSLILCTVYTVYTVRTELPTVRAGVPSVRTHILRTYTVPRFT